MKKLMLIALAILLGGGVAFAYDAGTDGHKIESSGGDAARPVRVYQLFRYAERGQDSRSLSEGEVVVQDCVSDDGVTIALVGSTNSTDAVVGVVISTIQTADTTGSASNSIGTRNWGYVQTYGLNDQAMVEATAAAGQALAASSTASYATPYGAANSWRAGGIFAYVLDAVSTTADDVEIFIKNR